jgi:hypothetical protein
MKTQDMVCVTIIYRYLTAIFVLTESTMAALRGTRRRALR